MSVPEVLALIAGVLAAIEEFSAKERSLLAWAVLLIAIALLWGKVA